MRDDMDDDCECPVCGAEIGQQCCVDDPQRDGMEIELGAYVHAERISSSNVQGDGSPDTNTQPTR